jgi:quinol monooxygenase YgiN
LKFLSVIAFTPILTGSKEANGMYGLISKLAVVPGKRDEMIAILSEGAAKMPGCFSYIVAKDSSDENAIWVTEVWDNAASHDASLSLPSVRNAMVRGKALIAGFEKVATTKPVWGIGLPGPV